MDAADPMRFLIASVFVLGLLGLFALALKRFGQSKFFTPLVKENARLSIVETQYIDHKRRLVLVKRDDKGHLLLLADGRETVIESFESK